MKKFLRKKDVFMIINCTQLNYNSCRITFALINPLQKYKYHGLLISSFDTTDMYIYNCFDNYGKWLSRRNKYVQVLIKAFYQKRGIKL